MNEINTGGHAFPTDAYYNEKRYGVYDGMSLRDYFAAKALPVVMQASDIQNVLTWSDWAQRVTVAAYEVADAMLKARDQS